MNRQTALARAMCLEHEDLALNLAAANGPLWRKPMLSAVLAVLLGFTNPSAPKAAPLHIYWIDVEGGGATLIVTPARESILVDTGWNLDLEGALIYDVATMVAHTHQIAYFVATHWHADHYGGAIKLSQRMPIKRYYANGPYPDNVADDPAFPTLMPQYKALV